MPTKMNYDKIMLQTVQFALIVLFFAIVTGVIKPENGMDMNETRNVVAALIVGLKVMDIAALRSTINILEKRDLGAWLNKVLDAAKVISDATMGSAEPAQMGSVVTTTTVNAPVGVASPDPVYTSKEVLPNSLSGYADHLSVEADLSVKE